MSGLTKASIFLAAASATPAIAHVWELPNKLHITDGPTWLLIQQTLYAGWGPVVGPLWLATSAALIGVVVGARGRAPWAGAAIALACYAGMFTAFYFLNQPTNLLILEWEAATLPFDWSKYRLGWELGHASSAVLAIGALLALLRDGAVANSSRQQM